MNEKKYLLNGKSVSAKDIIREAQVIDAEFNAQSFHSTSKAAQILRDVGAIVKEKDRP